MLEVQNSKSGDVRRWINHICYLYIPGLFALSLINLVVCRLDPPPAVAPLVKSAVGTPAANATTGSLTGTLTLTATVPDILIGPQDACQGVRAAADMVPGAEVVVRDFDSGGVLGRGMLESGRVTARTSIRGDCQFDFTVSGLGTGWETVKVEVGDGSRGSVTYTLDEVTAAGWTVALGVEQP